jgi:oligopeptide transport system substrate-binding protein
VPVGLIRQPRLTSVKRVLFWGDRPSRGLSPEVQFPPEVIGIAHRTAWMSWFSRPLLLLIVLTCVTLTVAISACTKEDETERPRDEPAQQTRQSSIGGTYRRPLGNDPASLDPARIADEYAVAVANQIYDSLVEFDAHLNVLPGLAQSWSASTDGLVWTFHLQRGVQFHNGREMTAADVVYSLSRLLDPAVRSPRSWSLAKVKGAARLHEGVTRELEGIKAVDRYVVQITLTEPFAPFISIIGLPHLAIVPREEVERLGGDFAVSPVGTGPFRFVNWERGREIVLEANKNYFRGRPSLDNIRFVIFPGNVQSEIVRAFERGELEESPIPPDRYEQMLKQGGYRVVRKPTLSLLLLGFNIEHAPFDQREVRVAFNHAVDKVRMNREIRYDHYVVAKGILPPGMPGYDPEVQGYSYAPDQAKNLLAQAGHAGGRRLETVTLGSGAKSNIARRDYEAVRQDIGSLGVQVELREFDSWPTFQQALQRNELQMFRYAWTADYPDPDGFLYPLFHSQSQTNYFRYHNPVVDGLLDKARQETDELKRVELYREAEQRILQDAPAVTLLHYTYERLFQPYVDGIEISALGESYVPMWKVRLRPLAPVNPGK